MLKPDEKSDVLTVWPACLLVCGWLTQCLNNCYTDFDAVPFIDFKKGSHLIFFIIAVLVYF